MTAPTPGQEAWRRAGIKDYTCGACFEEFGSNCDPGDIQCTNCDARLCPRCGSWFGELGEIDDDEQELPDYVPGSVDIPGGERDVVEILVPAPHATPELAVVMAERDDYAARLRAADQSWTRIAVERDALRERAEAAEAAKRAAKGELAALENRLAQAIVAALMAERARIRELADRSGAVCTGAEGTSHYFSALLTEGPQ
jgi:hypothetical protein